LNSTNPSQPNTMCLKFWYYFYGMNDPNNFLQITTIKSNGQPNPIIWTKTSQLISQSSITNQWLYGRATFLAALNDKVQIQAQITNPNSVIAIDDVLVQSQACEQPGWCDFEGGKHTIY
jgi:hypothetical protein